ncbi:hypothetical protein JW992_04630 [candidate division KSB1 bacterium]|nr:hypothetical protein [candidate division KSB1 bacterium]
MKSKKGIVLLLLALAAVLLSSCAPNNDMYLAKTAGFWAGLWHGLICVVTFIISLFTDRVGVYEINNSGSWYDFGFILGILISVGHGGVWNPVKKNLSHKCEKEKEWEEIGNKVEEKVRTGIQNWLNETDQQNPDWQEIGKKVEEKIKRELRNWAEK